MKKAWYQTIIYKIIVLVCLGWILMGTSAFAAWQTGFETGMDNTVRALAFTSDGKLYAGGLFTTAGGMAASRIAIWNGNSWQALGSGLNNQDRALAFTSDGKLYAGGNFTIAGGVAASRIALWNGSSWQALGSGLSSQDRALAIANGGTLYAGGLFTTAGGGTADYVARWNGSAWSALGSGMNGAVNALAVESSGALYAGGLFTTAGGVSANYVARWDGSTWSALGSGMNSTVNALAVGSDGTLYAGGSFITADGLSANYVARWNGSAWSALGNGMNSTVNALVIGTDGALYAGGNFTTAGGVPANYVACWNGSAWEALGNGMDNSVYVLTIGTDGAVYAGGDFTTAGGISSVRIAQWTNPEINIKQGETNISSGGSYDFGKVLVGETNEVTFTIENLGIGSLKLTGTPDLAALGGTHADQFTVTQQPTTPVAPGSPTTFKVQFNPTSVGAKTATVTIANDDSDESSYTFTLNGTGHAAPTDITLSSSSVAENEPSGTTVGTFTTTDPDAGDTHTYSLVAGEGDADNGSFTIDGDALKTNAVFDFETKNSYSIRVRTTDSNNQYYEEAFTITVTDVNDAPTDLSLSNSSVAENEPSGTTVGTFTTTDQDTGDTFTYALVAGDGDTDNASFTIDGDTLKTNAVFDFETQNSYSIRVRTTDQGGAGLWYEEAFTITVTDVAEETEDSYLLWTK